MSLNTRLALRALFAPSDYKKHQSGYSPFAVFFPPHFAVAGFAPQALIHSRKTSVA